MNKTKQKRVTIPSGSSRKCTCEKKIISLNVSIFFQGNLHASVQIELDSVKLWRIRAISYKKWAFSWKDTIKFWK